MDRLLEIREQIDHLDNEIVRLFFERMQLSEEVARYKIEHGKEVLNRQREEEKLAVLAKKAETPFGQNGVRELFGQIMTISRKRQYQMITEKNVSLQNDYQVVDQLNLDYAKVVFQGVEGAYGQAAMLQFFPKTIEATHVAQFEEAMEAVSSNKVDYAILPIDNSSVGAVTQMYDLLTKYDNYILDETYVQIKHALLALPGAKIEDIKTVYSHPQGLMQCADFLGKYPSWQQVSLANTAVSAMKVIEDQDYSQAAIASETAAKLYGLQILEHSINYNKNNTTRFVIVGNEKKYKADAKKISICVEIDHQSGSLYHLISHFIFNGINMTKIESRPIPERTWDYRFFIDFEGNLSEAGVQNALSGIQAESKAFRLLGNY